VGDRAFCGRKAVLCSRSVFFDTLLTSPNFREGRENARLAEAVTPTPPQDVSLEFGTPYSLAIALRWMYSDRVDEDLSADTLLEVGLLFSG
jgi:hypothetical protein